MEFPLMYRNKPFFFLHFVSICFHTYTEENVHNHHLNEELTRNDFYLTAIKSTPKGFNMLVSENYGKNRRSGDPTGSYFMGLHRVILLDHWLKAICRQRYQIGAPPSKVTHNWSHLKIKHFHNGENQIHGVLTWLKLVIIKKVAQNFRRN